MNLRAASVMGQCPDTQDPTISLPMQVHYQHLDIVLKTVYTHVSFCETCHQLINKFLDILDLSKEAGVHT